MICMSLIKNLNTIAISSLSQPRSQTSNDTFYRSLFPAGDSARAASASGAPFLVAARTFSKFSRTSGGKPAM